MKRVTVRTILVTLWGTLVLLPGCFLRPNDPPVALFTARPPEGSAPLFVMFDASGSYDPDGSVETYSWSFGDGASGNGASPTHVYAQPGSYAVQLTVEDRRHALGTVTSVVTARSGANYAVVVGIASYARMRSLNFADNDAISVAERLGTLPGWSSDRVRVLLNSEATAANFARLLGELGSRTEDDLVFVFFSGHGSRVRDASGDEADGFDEVLCFYDTDLLDDTLALWLDDVPVGRMVVMMDACYSGGQLNSFGVKELEASAGDGLLEDLSLVRDAGPRDLDRHSAPLVALSASRHNELSWEYASLRHGIFAYAVLEALDGQADGEGDRDGMTSAEECFGYVGPRVRYLARTGGVVEVPQMLDLCPGELEFAGVP